MMFQTKKGQSLSLNVIIVAALALIVLVVLIAIFTGRISIFDRSVSQAGEAEIVKMRIQYGECRPTDSSENGFSTSFGSATSDAQKEDLKATFRDEIRRCKELSNDKGVCEQGGCAWN